MSENIARPSRATSLFKGGQWVRSPNQGQHWLNSMLLYDWIISSKSRVKKDKLCCKGIRTLLKTPWLPWYEQCCSRPCFFFSAVCWPGLLLLWLDSCMTQLAADWARCFRLRTSEPKCKILGKMLKGKALQWRCWKRRLHRCWRTKKKWC